MSATNERFPPGAIYLITRLYPRGRVFQRPAAEINEALRDCIGEAARRGGVEVLSLQLWPRYCRIFAKDRRGRFPEFMERIDQHVRRLDRSPGRGHAFWARGSYCLVRVPGTGPRSRPVSIPGSRRRYNEV